MLEVLGTCVPVPVCDGVAGGVRVCEIDTEGVAAAVPEALLLGVPLELGVDEGVTDELGVGDGVMLEDGEFEEVIDGLGVPEDVSEGLGVPEDVAEPLGVLLGVPLELGVLDAVVDELGVFDAVVDGEGVIEAVVDGLPEVVDVLELDDVTELEAVRLPDGNDEAVDGGDTVDEVVDAAVRERVAVFEGLGGVYRHLRSKEPAAPPLVTRT